ncbi:type II CRISPR RNA-guided endonuclease Cas9 [Parabacteroides sp. Marseille-P3160]|uniref:type II CRISPR RNA-guided endonuclease Cas9 n=1 Tax=Parabacteroides sp. Marseille-P3160 TaxID=1917887 RepID=UPI0009BAC67F|nr:type II CRISPR RNA-guided endonuclease Cas9 [Parabacteroides sp. Marseille-P3160]
MKKHILGLDLGTNSVGWALLEVNENGKPYKIRGMGSRIIPMSQDILGNFENGNSISQTAERTDYRGTRRLRERHLLRRERLHRVLNVLGFLPEHYASQIDFEKRLGQFASDTEPKLAWKKLDEGKFEFIFQKSFNEMITDFKNTQPQLLKEGKLIPYDWTIYYLRKKALTQKIEKEELAWILLNFNQKRGYYQLRGEDEEENPNKLVEFYALKVVDITADGPQRGKTDIWYNVVLENGWVYHRSSKVSLTDWIGKTKEFIVTTDLNDDGTIKIDKEGNEKRSFRAPSADDWTLLKKKTEADINKSNQTVGEYIYEALLQNPKQKIKGKLVRTIERKFYKEELRQILLKQKGFHQELQNEDLYNEAVRELYRNNESQQLSLAKKDFISLFLNDIIFYQRPLRSQKSSISNCTLEFRKYKDKDNIEHIEYLKASPKSNPYYQEFRLWQWINNLAIYRRDDDANVTQEFLNQIEKFEDLFDFLNNRKEIKQDVLIKYFLEKKGYKGKALTNEVSKYRWNFVDDKDKAYPCNETRYLITNRLEKVQNTPSDFLNREIEQQLWHIIYSVTDKAEFEKALKSFAEKHQLDMESFVDNFRKFPPFRNEYGSFSEKAIKKLLPLMRFGKYWNWEAIDPKTKDRIDKIITGEYNEEIKDKVREKAIHLSQKENFQGLQLWLASYIVYGRHSEANAAEKWNTVEDLETFLKNFKQHSLRNPIVEQVVTETLRVLKDIWKHYGNGAKDFFSEIHIELGREMKLPTEERQRLTKQITENEITNLRIKSLLAEMENYAEVENVRPLSPMQQEVLKIYEDSVLNSGIEIDDDILKISKTAQPSSSELRRYKLWLEQRYRSPYTGTVIPLNKLFTSDYEIEHIIPQSRYFDDSFSNKVICESAVNKLKGNQLGLEFIKEHPEEMVEIGFGKKVRIFNEKEYLEFVKEHYSKNRSKRSKLLMEEIPEKMIERQINDTRYISKYISSLLSNIVREEIKDDGVNSKNLIPLNGKITTRLKQDWGLNDIWNDLILPRFERMNQLTNSTDFITYNERYQKYLPTVPIEVSKNFQKKRIDHRHHAMDALVIACATRSHVNYMNNQYALDKSKTKEEKQVKREDLRTVLCYKKYNDNFSKSYNWFFKKPWDSFTVDARNELEKIIVSFKQNLRVINKSVNYYQHYVDGKKVIDKQTKGDNWAIRKSLHKEFVYAKVNLVRIKVSRGKFITAIRKKLDTSFDLKTIDKITDTGIQKILKNYLSYKKSPELAFSPEGIEDLNNNIEKFNDGKKRQPIHKVRIFEIGSRFPLGETGNKKSKYVEAAKGTNLFFAIYVDEEGNRSYETIPLNIVIERLKQGLTDVPEINEKGDKLLFHLSPNDLVYVPTEEENAKPLDREELHQNRIYKMVSSSGSQCFFIKSEVANSIVNKIEYSALNKMERAIDGTMIKQVCIKLKVDRLGKVEEAFR